MTTARNGAPHDRIKRACKGINTAGQACRAVAVGDDGYCPAHRPGGRSMVELGRQGGKASVKAREKTEQHARDRLRRRVDKNFDLVWAAFMSGLESPDANVRFRAASQLLSQAYGSPAAAAVEEAGPAVFILESSFPRADTDAD